jgi:hypothetical protein
MVYENRMLRKIFGSNRDEITGEWMTLHNEELCDVFSSLEGAWGGKHVSPIEDRICAYSVSVERSEGRRPFRRHRHRWEGNIKVGLQQLGRRSINWIDLPRDRDSCRALMNA